MSISNSYQADIIIVGGGIAGIITAYELLQSGQKVLLIDRDTEANFGGLAKWAFGGMFFVNSKHQKKAGIKDSVSLALRDWHSFAQYGENESWGPKWAEQYIHLCTPHGYDWLKKKGIGFFPVLNWVERGLYEPGNSVPRFHMVWGTGWELTYGMIRHLKGHPRAENLALKFGHRVLEVTTSGKRITGVRGAIEGSGEEFEAKADVVVVASGGINGSIERVKKHWHKDFGNPPEVILNGAHQYAIGDLHDAVGNIKGNITFLDRQWNYAAGIRHYAPRKADHGLSLVPCKSALWLNYQGKRFGPMPLVTAYDTRYLVERICEEPVKYSWQILNRKIADKEFAISGSEHNELFRDKKFVKFVLQTLLSGNKKLVDKVIDKCEDVIVAYSIDELVEKMNALTGDDHVKKEYVEDAINIYDAHIERGPKLHNDEQIRRIEYARQYRGDKARTAKFQKINEASAMPLIAIREFILSRKSLGGIQTNLDGNVMTKPDSNGIQHAIDGLYAVGEAAGFGGGGIHGHRSLEGTFLGGCVITARVTANAILGKKLQS